MNKYEIKAKIGYIRSSISIASGSVNVPVLMLAFFFTLVMFCNRHNFDSDNHFQLAHAKVILEQGFVTEDPLSMHPGMNFIIPQWASAMLIYGLFQYGGLIGMNLFFSGVMMATLYVLYKWLAIIDDNRCRCVLTAFLVMAMEWFACYSTRPHVVSMFFITCELYVLERYKRDRSRTIWLVPFLSVLFINFHNSLWVFLFIAALPYLAEYLVERFIRHKSIPLPTAGIFSFLLAVPAGLINPYGAQAITYIFRSMGSIAPMNSYIGELRPTTLSSIWGWFLGIPVFIIVCLAKFPIRREIPVRHALLGLGTYAMALMHCRSWTQTLICIAPIMAEAMSGMDMELVELKSTKGTVLPLITLTVLASSALGVGGSGQTLTKTLSDTEYIEVLDEKCGSGARVFNTINLGAMLEYYGFHPFIDTRLEVYGEANNGQYDYLTEYTRAVHEGIGVKELLEKYDFDAAVMEKNDNAVYLHLDESPDLEKVYDGEGVTIFVPSAIRS